MSLQDRLGPWHGVLFVSFCLGAGLSVRSMDFGSVGVAGVIFAIIGGLLTVLGVNVTLGTVWGYVDEHRQAGGDLTEPVFLAPFGFAAAIGLVVAAVVVAYPPLAAGRTELLAAQVAYVGLVGAFCAFVLGMWVVTVVVNLRAGYEDARVDGADGQ